MHLLLVFANVVTIFCLTACVSNLSKPEQGHSLNTCTQPPQGGWPIHPMHFYDKDIHLVPNFSKAPANFKVPNFMTGYSVVFVKAGSIYTNMGLNYGDEIISIDEQSFDNLIDPQTSAPAILGKIKNHEFKKIQIRRCLEIR